MTAEQQGQAVIDRWDTVFTALSAEPRRQLVAALKDVSPTNRVLLPEAAMSPTVEPDRERLRVALLHQHLPLLADGGFVEWTDEPFRAARGSRFEEAAVVLDLIQTHAERVPDALVYGCRRLEAERRKS
jgi:hypothetical protein